jgi:hypothetical protein
MNKTGTDHLFLLSFAPPQRLLSPARMPRCARIVAAGYPMHVTEHQNVVRPYFSHPGAADLHSAHPGAAEFHSAQRIPHPGPPSSPGPRKERHQSPASRHQAHKPKRAGQSAGVVQPKIMTGIKNTQRARPQADDWGLSPRRSWPNVLCLGPDRGSADGGGAWRCCRWTGDYLRCVYIRTSTVGIVW